MAAAVESNKRAQVMDRARELVSDISPQYYRNTWDRFGGSSNNIIFGPTRHQERTGRWKLRRFRKPIFLGKEVTLNGSGIHYNLYPQTEKENVRVMNYDIPETVVEIDDQALDHVIYVVQEWTRAKSRATKLVPSLRDWLFNYDEVLLFAKRVPEWVQPVSAESLDYIIARFNEIEKLVRECEPATSENHDSSLNYLLEGIDFNSYRP